MTDYISREAAIAAAFSANAFGNSALRDVYDTVKRIRMIPAKDVVERELYQRALSDVVRLSVERPERKHGKWIDRNGNVIYSMWERYECSVCGEYSLDYNFCPNCGADMRRGDNDV